MEEAMFRRKTSVNILIIVSLMAAVFLMVMLFLLFGNFKKEYDQMTFKDKVEAGLQTSLLVVGDSIGGSLDENDWCMLLAKKLDEEGIRTNIDNVSLGGNTVFAGYSQIAKYESDVDIIIFCFGQNDADNEDFPIMYENMIRMAKEKYPKAVEIAILESSQREYTNKINEIIELCNYYDIPYADMIDAYNNSGMEYDELTSDGTHPNAKGKELYADTAYKVIDSRILKVKEPFSLSRYFTKPSIPKPINSITRKASHYRYISKEAFEVDGLTISLDVDDEYTYVGADALFIRGEHGIVGRLEDESKFYIAYTWNYDSQHHVYKGSNDQPISGKITITFDCQDAFDNFYGLILCN